MFSIQDGNIWCTLPCNAREVSIEEAHQIVDLLSLLIPLAESAARQGHEDRPAKLPESLDKSE